MYKLFSSTWVFLTSLTFLSTPTPPSAVLIKAQWHEVEQNNNIAEILCREKSAAESSSPAQLFHLFAQVNESPCTLSDPASLLIILIRNCLDLAPTHCLLWYFTWTLFSLNRSEGDGDCNVNTSHNSHNYAKHTRLKWRWFNSLKPNMRCSLRCRTFTLFSPDLISVLKWSWTKFSCRTCIQSPKKSVWRRRRLKK